MHVALLHTEFGLVDDLTNALEAAGHQVRRYVDASALIHHAESEHFDLFLLEWNPRHLHGCGRQRHTLPLITVRCVGHGGGKLGKCKANVDSPWEWKRSPPAGTSWRRGQACERRPSAVSLSCDPVPSMKGQ